MALMPRAHSRDLEPYDFAGSRIMKTLMLSSHPPNLESSLKNMSILHKDNVERFAYCITVLTATLESVSKIIEFLGLQRNTPKMLTDVSAHSDLQAILFVQFDAGRLCHDQGAKFQSVCLLQAPLQE